MKILLTILGALAVIAGSLFSACFGDAFDPIGDFRNRNDRGKLKRSSDKYVTR